VLESGNVLFSYPIVGPYQLQGGGMKADVSKHLRGEVELDTASGHIVRTRIFAPKSFKPNMAARIKVYDVEQTYVVPLTGGPVLETSNSVKVTAKALVMKFNVVELTTRYGFEKR